jgi:hypothetical protein
MNEKLLANIRYYFAQSVFMNNIHYKAYNRLSKTKQRNRNIVIGVSGTTIILLILQIVCLENELQELLNVLAFVGLLITGTSLIFTLISKEDISIIMSNHKHIAEQYKCLRDEYMSFVEEVMSSAYPEDELRNKRNHLQKRYSALGEFAPETTLSDFKAAQKGLGLGNNSGEEFTWSDEEIDKFLPVQLRHEK